LLEAELDENKWAFRPDRLGGEKQISEIIENSLLPTIVNQAQLSFNILLKSPVKDHFLFLLSSSSPEEMKRKKKLISPVTTQSRRSLFAAFPASEREVRGVTTP